MPIYNRKLVKCGNVYHYYEYRQKFFKYGYSRRKQVLKGIVKSVYGERGRIGVEKRETHIYRAKRQVKWIIQSNSYREGFTPIFVTLTFRENITEIKQANYEFKKFIHRFNYKFGIKLQYLVVPEIQKKRAIKFGYAVWHYHVLFFNLPFIDNIYDHISDIWGLGFSISKTVFSDVYHIGNYVCKYFTKDIHEHRYRGQKSYFCSRGLVRPIIRVAYDSSLIDSSYTTKFKKQYRVRDYKVDYELIEKWI